MSHFTKLGLGLFVWGFFAWSAGCSKETPPSTPATSTTEGGTTTDMPAPQQPDSTTQPTDGNPAAQPGAEGETAAPAEGDQTMSAEVQAALASLSADDRELAIKQKICPVSGGPLGSMGTPIKVHVAGHDVFICCEHCEQPLKDDPATQLAKIGLQPVEEAPVQ
jgi:hypothetical protein